MKSLVARRNATLTLSHRGWAASAHDQVLLSAPCHRCGTLVTVRRSGVSAHRCERPA